MISLWPAALLAGCIGGRDDAATPVEDALLDHLVGILVTPDPVVLPLGSEAQLQATGLLDDRESVDLTASVGWRVADGSVARVSESLDQEGLAVGLAVGTTTVFAEYAGIRSPEITLTVTDAEIMRLSVEPDEVVVAEGDVVQMMALATFSNGDAGDVSGQVRWITGDGGVAQLDGDGTLSAVGAGATEVHVEWEGLASDPVPVTVTEADEEAAPDLLVAAASGGVAGGVLDLAVTVRNEGGLGASDFWVDVFVDPGGQPEVGEVGEDWTWVDYLGPGEDLDLSFSIEVAAGAHEVWILADTNDDVAESDESDNALAATVGEGSGTGSGGPDLTVSWFDCTVDEDGLLYYFVDVTNDGDEDADWFYVDLFVDRDDAPELYEDGDDYTTVAGLSAGGTTWADFLIDAWCAGCASWVLVDGYDNVAESDEDDNVEGPLEVWSW